MTAKAQSAPAPGPAGIAEIAAQAIALAERNDTPLTPRAFEIWYTFAEGSDSDLTKRLGLLMARDAPIGTAEIEALFADLTGKTDREAVVTRICERIQTEMTSLSSTMGQVETTNTQSIGKLKTARDTLPGLSRTKDLKRMVDTMLEVSEGQMREAKFLQSRLRESREEVASMRAELNELRDAAFRDHLTKLFNRSRLDRKLEEVCIEGDPEGRGVCLIMCDIDHFKRVNDTFGHQAGDAVIQQFAKIMQQNVKGKDFAARYGGEEFAVLLFGAEIRGARTVAETIRQSFAASRFVTQDTKKPLGRLTASFGVTRLRPGDDATSMVARADRLLYEAKEGGRDCVRAEE